MRTCAQANTRGRPSRPSASERVPMRTIDRRTFLRNTGVLGTWLAASNVLSRAAHADKPITFSGWVFKPDTVTAYVNFYNRKLAGQLKYEPLPSVHCPPTMETRALAGA